MDDVDRVSTDRLTSPVSKFAWKEKKEHKNWKEMRCIYKTRMKIEEMLPEEMLPVNCCLLLLQELLFHSQPHNQKALIFPKPVK